MKFYINNLFVTTVDFIEGIDGTPCSLFELRTLLLAFKLFYPVCCRDSGSKFLSFPFPLSPFPSHVLGNWCYVVENDRHLKMEMVLVMSLHHAGNWIFR